MSLSGPTLQCRVVVTKRDERIEGPDLADVVLSVPIDVAGADDFDATVEFMRGRLKATGSARELFDVLKQPSTSETLRRLASPS